MLRIDSPSNLSTVASRVVTRDRSRASPNLSRRSNSSSPSRLDARQYTIQAKQPEDAEETEIIISAWINDESFGLKMYDIMSMLKGDGLPKISNETFSIAPDIA